MCARDQVNTRAYAQGYEYTHNCIHVHTHVREINLQVSELLLSLLKQNTLRYG